MVRILLFFLLIGSFSRVYGQGASDLYLFNLYKSSDQRYHISNPKFLSGFNPGGYTNQPWFTSNGDLLVSVRKASEDQNDIYRLDLAGKRIKRISQTSTNEFSPRITPDEQAITFVRQIVGDQIDQQIFRLSLNGSEHKSIAPDLRNIGYYTWLNKNELGVFLLEGESNRLMYLHPAESKSQRITSSIGRTLLTANDGSILYVHKFTEDYWYLKKYNPASATIDIIEETPPKSEDFALAPDGSFFMGREKKLLFYNAAIHSSWQEIADLSIYGVHQISRLAISADGRHLALVSTRQD